MRSAMITPLRRGFNRSRSHATRQLGQAQSGLNEGLCEMAFYLLSKERMAAFIFQQDASMGRRHEGVCRGSRQRVTKKENEREMSH